MVAIYPHKSRAHDTALSHRAMIVEGYKQECPKDSMAVAIDMTCAGAAICRRCSRKGLRYEPYMRGSSYVVVVICADCGLRDEV